MFALNELLEIILDWLRGPPYANFVENVLTVYRHLNHLSTQELSDKLMIVSASLSH